MRIFFTKVGLFCLLFFLTPYFHTLYAQEEDSKQTIRNNKYKQIALKLEELYANGELEEVITLFKQSCLESTDDLAKETKEFKKTKKEFRAEIYSIVCRAYVGLDRPQLADRFLSKLFAIRVDEDFQTYWQSIKETRSYDYYVAPRLQFGFSAGGNLASPSPQERFSIFGGTADSRSYDKGLQSIIQKPQFLGFRFGGQLTYAFTKNIALTTIFSSSSLRFSYTDQLFWQDAPVPNVNLLIRTERNSFHIANYLDIPLMLRYQFLPKQNFKPYLLLGGYYSRRLIASKEVSIQEFPSVTIDGVKQDLFGNSSNVNVEITDLLNPTDYGIMAGIGTTYAYQYFRFSLSATYRYGLNNIINPDKRYNNQELVFGYHDIFDNLRLNQLNFQFGVSYVTYKAFRR